MVRGQALRRRKRKNTPTQIPAHLLDHDDHSEDIEAVAEMIIMFGLQGLTNEELFERWHRDYPMETIEAARLLL